MLYFDTIVYIKKIQ